MDNQVESYREGVERILYRDYADRQGYGFRWLETVLPETDLEGLLLEGYTEEAAAQKIFEENSKMIKPVPKDCRPNREGKGQGVREITGIKLFQAAVRTDRYYCRLPTETVKMLFQKVLRMLSKK